jgi:hypothetical protein
METTLKIIAYIWMAICAVSHVRIEAKKRGNNTSFKTLKVGYIIQISYYWFITALFII